MNGNTTRSGGSIVVMQKASTAQWAGLALVAAISGCCQTTFYAFLYPTAGAANTQGLAFTLANMLACALCMLGFSACARRFTCSPRLMRAMFVAFMTAGFALLFIHGALGSYASGSDFLLVAEAALLGCGLGCGRLLFLSSMVVLNAKELGRALCFSAFLAGALAFLMRLVAPLGLSVALLAALFVGAAVLSHWTVCGSGRPQLRTEPPHLGAVAKALLGPGCFASIAAFASGALRAVAHYEDSFTFVLLLFICSLTGAGLYLLANIFSKHGAVQFFNRGSVRIALLALIATVFLLFPFVGSTYWALPLLVVDTLYMVMYIYMQQVSLTTARDLEASPLVTIGMFEGSVFLVTAVGMLANKALGVSAGQDSTGALVLALVAIYVVVMGCIGVFANLGQPRGESGKEASVGTPLLIGIDESVIRSNRELTLTYQLTDREMDVLVLTMSGLNADGIATQLGVSKNTVRTHQQKLYRKLDIHTKEELQAFVRTLATR